MTPARQYEYDVVIIGAGPAGSAAATCLAKAGRSVLLLERDHFPRRKLCGEFLSPAASTLFNRLGCYSDFQQLQPASVGSAHFHLPDGQALDVALPSQGFALRRWVLDQMLFQHALQCGVDGITGAEVVKIDETGTTNTVQFRNEPGDFVVKSNVTIGAWGRRSKLDPMRHSNSVNSTSSTVGISRHLRPRSTTGNSVLNALRNRIAMYPFQGGYCGLTFVENGEINCCMLLKQKTLKALSVTHWESIVDFLRRANPALRLVLEQLEPAEETMLTFAPVPMHVKRHEAHNMFFVGDACSMIPPVCGDGQSMAMEAGIQLAELLLENPAHLQVTEKYALLIEWRRRWKRTFVQRMRIGRGVQWLMMHENCLRLTAGLMRCFPVMAQWTMRKTRSI